MYITQREKCNNFSEIFETVHIDCMASVKL